MFLPRILLIFEKYFLWLLVRFLTFMNQPSQSSWALSLHLSFTTYLVLCDKGYGFLNWVQQWHFLLHHTTSDHFCCRIWSEKVFIFPKSWTYKLFGYFGNYYQLYLPCTILVDFGWNVFWHFNTKVNFDDQQCFMCYRHSFMYFTDKTGKVPDSSFCFVWRRSHQWRSGHHTVQDDRAHWYKEQFWTELRSKIW